MTGAEIAEILTRWAAQGVTGAIEWRDGKRRRLFFFEAGQLVGLQSNLKSESPSRVSEKFPGLDQDELRIKVAEVRLRGALEEIEGQVESHIGAAPPVRDPVDLIALLWAVADTLPRPPERSYPRVRPGGATTLAMVPFPSAVAGYLVDLDGSRAIDDVTAFGPADPETLYNALSLGVLLGALDAAELEAPATVVTTQRLADTPVATAQRRPSASSVDEIGAFIQEGMSAAAPNPDGYEVVLPRARVDRGPTERPAAPPAPAAPPPPAAPATPDLLRAHARMRAAANHFEVLGVAPDAHPEVIRRAYFALARDLHPDRWITAGPESRERATELFDLVRAAWEVLSDDEARERYIARAIRGEKSEEERAMDRVREILEAETEFKRALAELAAGRFGPASEIFQRASARVPDDQEMAAYAAFAAFRATGGKDPRKAEAALEALDLAVREKEKFDQGHVMIGQIHVALGDEAAARQSFIAALKIRPTNPDATRELKRGQARQAEAREQASGGFFSKLFGKK